VRAEYERRRVERSQEHERHVAVERRLSHVRLLLALAIVVVGWMGFVSKVLSPAWTALPLLAFAFVVVRHHLLTEARIRAGRAATYYREGLARIDGRWSGTGPMGRRFALLSHLYAADLDIFGEGSLFQMLCRARTRAGERVLADWLRAPATPDEVRARQEAVAELRDRLDLREELAVEGETLEELLEPDPLRGWASGEAHPAAHRARLLASTFPIVSVAALAAWWMWPWAVIPVLLVLAAQTVFAGLHRKTVKKAREDAERAGADLDLLVALFSRLTQEEFRSARLRELMEGHGNPDGELRLLKKLIDRSEAPGNLFFAPIAALLLWTTRHAFAIEAWRSEHGAQLCLWLDIAGEFEAFSSLATYAAEQPDDPFPEFAEDGPLFGAQDLGHPLLPAAECVRNSVTLSAKDPLILVSGSNMSGKSTLLRSVGVATVMASMGAPVRAKELRLSPLQVGASIVSRDSIREGTSRFYAEITRLRDIVGAAKSGPTLYLLDEVLMGTNSHDRRIGAAALMRGLVAAGAIGLVTTHDLALTEIAGARNVHFSDQMENGKMEFDHLLRDGVVTHSNALELMRSVGLDV
jgi:predicted ATPase